MNPYIIDSDSVNMYPRVDSFDSRGKRSIQGSKCSNSSPRYKQTRLINDFVLKTDHLECQKTLYPILRIRGLSPNAPPLQEKGDKFIPLKCPDFEAEITLPMNVSPDDSITLFTLYYTPEIIDQIVRHTNNAPQTA